MPLRTPTLLLTGLTLGALMCSIGTALAGPLPGHAPIPSHIDAPISTLPADAPPNGNADTLADTAPAAPTNTAPIVAKPGTPPSGNADPLPVAVRRGGQSADPSPHGRSDVAFDAAPTPRSNAPPAGASGHGVFPLVSPGRAPETVPSAGTSAGMSPGQTSGLPPPDLPLSRPGRFGWPLAPPHAVVRPFQPPATQYGPGHRGVDLGGQPGEPVLAAGDGVVVFAGPLAGRGVVSIDHGGGLRTTYEPLTVLVSAGQPVERGTVIGQLASGHEGCAAPACLHWGAHRGREYLDPLGLLSAGHVRLLPWEG
jgi:murein DD-endopeptidase MepM/ murein hydrolase activator NlpD